MSPQRTNIIRQVAQAILCLILLSAVAAAHGGLEHVMGVVQEMNQTSVTVSTTDGKSRAVALDAKTTYEKNGHAVQVAEIKVGDRVVIHAAKVGDKFVARTVQASIAK